MPAPRNNRNASKKETRHQVGLRLTQKEKRALERYFGGVTNGVRTLLSEEVTRRAALHAGVRGELLAFVQDVYQTHRTTKATSTVTPFYEDERVTLYLGDAQTVLSQLVESSVDCIFTSPPYYGQRDYGMRDQIGLEPHPAEYLARLIGVFQELKRVTKSTGSVWVNIGDTYWSGKGQSKGTDKKQKNRRFHRPQDYAGERPWCTPKQLLLIPHRFAMLMQEHGWIVRNDNVWHKPDPIPDPVDDRCARSHEYIFHFVKQREYYFDSEAIAIPTQSKDSAQSFKPHPSVWTITTSASALGKKHIAVFPQALATIPVCSTCRPDGIFLDPFCGSGTSLVSALCCSKANRVIGIDSCEAALIETIHAIKKLSTVSVASGLKAHDPNLL